MRAAWKGVVILGIVFWVFVGALGFYANMQNSTGSSTVSFTKFSDEPFEIQETILADKPWYERMLPGVGTMVGTLVPGRDKTVARSYLDIPESEGGPTCSITVSPESVPYGGSATVTWISRNAQLATLQGVGNVAVSSSYTAENLTSTESLVLAVSGPGGRRVCSTTINVLPIVEEAPSCIISANPEAVSEGESVSLAWGAKNAASAALTGIGDVDLKSGLSLTPRQSTNYVLTVRTVTGREATCEAAVLVQ